MSALVRDYMALFKIIFISSILFSFDYYFFKLFFLFSESHRYIC